MAAYLEHPYTSHEEWLALRQRGIGGSDVAALLGLNPYKSPLAVYLEKTTPLVDAAGSSHLVWGKKLEPVIRDAFMEQTGLAVTTPQAIYQSREFPFMQASLDGEGIDHEGHAFIVECKNTTRRDVWQGDEIPIIYLPQLLHYLAVTGAAYGRFAVLANGHDFFVTDPIPRNEAAIAALIDKEAFFWREYVQKGVLPPISPTPADIEAASHLATQPDADAMPLPHELAPLLEKRERLRERQRELDREQEQIDLQLKAALGTHSCGVCQGFFVSWKSFEQTRFQTKLFQQAHPDLYAQFTTTITARRFDVKRED